MRNIFLALLMLTIATSVCFAQQPIMPSTGKATAQAVETKTFTGKVESVSLVDPVKGTKSEIVVVDEKGQKNTFLVKDVTTLYDAGYKAITLDKIVKDQTVKVKYVTTKDGVTEATLIRVIK